MVDGCPFRFQFEKSLFFVPEIVDEVPVEIEPSVKGETVGEFTGPESQDVTGFMIDRVVYLRKDVRNVSRYFNVQGIEVDHHDAVRTGEGTPLNNVDGFVSAAYMVFRARTIPYDAAFCFSELYL